MNLKNIFTIMLTLCALIFISSCNDDKNQNDISDNKKQNSLRSGSVNKIIDTIKSFGQELKPGNYIFLSPKGNYIPFCYSNEVDSVVSNPEFKEKTMTIVANAACDGPDFDATYRAKVKYTPSRSTLERNVNPNNLVNYFAEKHPEMCENKNNLPNDSRLMVENRNVELLTVFIYTFKRQGDEDYHVILGTTKNVNTAKFFNSEISGLSPSGSYKRSNLVEARNTFEEYFGVSEKCATSYYKNDFRNHPIPVKIEGSLFYDGEHCTSFKNNGPQNWKELEIEIAWEIHPITSIEFLE